MKPLYKIALKPRYKERIENSDFRHEPLLYRFFDMQPWLMGASRLASSDNKSVALSRLTQKESAKLWGRSPYRLSGWNMYSVSVPDFAIHNNRIFMPGSTFNDQDKWRTSNLRDDVPEVTWDDVVGLGDIVIALCLHSSSCIRGDDVQDCIEEIAKYKKRNTGA